MFGDLDILDSVIGSMLDDSSAPPEVKGADVSFLTPDKSLPALQNATIVLFLYEVKENRLLRDPVPIVEKVGSQYIRRLPPLRMDCSYIVTAWSKAQADQRVSEEHRLLARTLAWLSLFPTIPGKYLQGTSLQDQPFPLPMVVAQMHDDTNMGQFWTALGISPRVAFFLTVTLALDAGLPSTGFLVSTRSTSTASETGPPDPSWVQIGGRVLDPGGAGIADARVDVTDTGLRAVSDEDGRYSFLRVPVGDRAVRVVAQGFQLKSLTVKVPDSPEKYEITLTPL